MQKVMTAKFRGTCSHSGARINPGDQITFDTVTRKAWFTEPGDCQIAPINKNYVSDVYSIGGREYYRNKRGLCIDAPCCGCCTI